MTRSNSVFRQCPCGRTSGKRALAYQVCCGRYLDDFAGNPAPDAESLMRSRYTAFVLCREDYLLATWHGDTRPAAIEFDEATKWLGLSVRSVVEPRDSDPATAWVDFVARSRREGWGHRMHEHSRFLLLDGRWFYIDGEMLS